MVDRVRQIADALRGNRPCPHAPAETLEWAATEILRLADELRDIAYPIERLEREAAENGNRLDGMMAIRFAADPDHLRSVARAAIAWKPEQNTTDND